MTASFPALRDLPTQDVLASNIRAILRTAEDDEIAAGHAWYPDARQWCSTRAARHSLTHETVAAVVAVTSPQLEWDRNLDAADIILDAHAVGGTSAVRALSGLILPNGIERAARALDDPSLADVRRMRGTLKVHMFWRNLCGQDFAVTVDRHALRVALADVTSPIEGIGTDAAYLHVAESYRQAALEEGMPPATLQAITWIVMRNMRRHLMSAPERNTL